MLFRSERERLFHGVRKKRDGAGGDEPAADAGLDELRDSGDVSRYDGALQGEGFHDDDREAFGKAGENQGAGADCLLRSRCHLPFIRTHIIS